MSAITKPCPSEHCVLGERVDCAGDSLGKCPACSGTGRVPDVEATLRAENATLRESLERALVCLYGADATLDDARKVPTMVNVELDKRDAEIARLRGEVERLTARERRPALRPIDPYDPRYGVETHCPSCGTPSPCETCGYGTKNRTDVTP